MTNVDNVPYEKEIHKINKEIKIEIKLLWKIYC